MRLLGRSGARRGHPCLPTGPHRDALRPQPDGSLALTSQFAEPEDTHRGVAALTAVVTEQLARRTIKTHGTRRRICT